MNTAIGAPRTWLDETEQLDLSHPKIHITALKLTQAWQTLPDRAQAVHAFVRQLPFGAFYDVSHVRASDVIKARRGDCHSKGVLFVALCRSAGLAARLRFVRVRTGFLKGILDEGPETMAHAVGQVLLDGRWVSTDGYVVDPVLFAQARQRLREVPADSGWGLASDAPGVWDGRADCLQQYRPEDVVHDYGAYDDPREFYEELSAEEGAPSWVSRLKYALGAQLVNRRVAQLRAAPSSSDRAAV